MRRTVAALALLLTTGAGVPPAYAADVAVFCSNGLRAVLSQVAPEFEQQTGHHLVVTYSVSTELKKRIDAGERFDIAILTPGLIDQLAAAGTLRADTRTSIARSAIGIAIRRGTRKPDLQTVDAVTTTLNAARSISFAREGAGGQFFTALIQRLGLSDRLAAKLKPVTTGQDVSRAVANGDAELGIQPVSEILNVAGVELGGTFPPAVQDYAVMTAAVARQSPRASESRALIDFLMSRELDAVVRSKGMERVP